MTDSMKFPSTDIESPIALMAFVKPTGKVIYDAYWIAKTDRHKPNYYDGSIKYLRADTVIPKEVVEKMLDDAYEAGFYRAAYHNKCSSSAAKLDSINEIRGRYESSNSD